MRKKNMKLYGIITYNNQNEMKWYIEDARKNGFTILFIPNAALMYKK